MITIIAFILSLPIAWVFMKICGAHDRKQGRKRAAAMERMIERSIRNANDKGRR